MKATGPGGMSQSTLTMVAPPRPIAFIASRSAVMPAFVMLPFIQCHQVCGLAESGGVRKPDRNTSLGAADADRERPSNVAPRIPQDTFRILLFVFLRMIQDIIRTRHRVRTNF